MPLLFASNKVMVSCIEAHVMLKPMLLGLRLATPLKACDSSKTPYPLLSTGSIQEDRKPSLLLMTCKSHYKNDVSGFRESTFASKAL